MKKLLSVCLVLVMLLSAFGITASAEAIVVDDYTTKVGDIYYYIEGDEAYIVGYELDSETEPQGAVSIPETIRYRGNNYVVTAVIEEAFYRSTFTKITLPSTIYYIGDYAFGDSFYLEKVVIPNDCYFYYFGGDVFTGAPFEAEIYSQDETVFGQNVLYSYIGNGNPYVMPDSIEIIAPKCFFMSGIKSVVISGNVTEIPYCAFASCRNLTSVDIPDNVEIVGDGAFKDCTKLQTVTLGDSVRKLGFDCFANSGIKSLHLGQEVYSVFGAFRGCKSLEKITVDPGNTALKTDGKALYFNTNFIMNGVGEGYILAYYFPTKAVGKVKLVDDVIMIGPYAFYGCDKLDEVVADETSAIDTGAFSNSSIKKFTGGNLTTIWDSAFKNCYNLTDIDLTYVESIENAAFENCTALTEVEFCEDIYNIGTLAFSNTGLKEVTIYGDDCEIKEAAFKGCQNLESVTLEEGVYQIGMDAFLNCPKLETIYLSKTVEKFDHQAFNGCDDVTFEVIRGTAAYKYITNETDFDYEVVGRYSFLQKIIDFFRALFGIK